MLSIVEERRNEEIKKLLAGEFPTIVYLRDAHEGKGDECWVPCAKGDIGAVKFISAE